LEDFNTTRLPTSRSAVAPDGSDVRELLRLKGGSMTHFKLPPGQTSTAVSHSTTEEIWYFLSGRGEMWRRQNNREEIVPIEKGVCITLPLGTHLQFRSHGHKPLEVIAITMPPWPGKGEVYEVKGKWQPTVP